MDNINENFSAIILKNWTVPELEAIETKVVPQPKITLGTVLCAQWGYEANNVDFYIVTKKTTHFVTVMKLESKFVRWADYGMQGDKWVTASNTPKLKTIREYNSETSEIEVISSSVILLRRKIRINYRGEECIDIESYAAAHIWDGKPVLDYNHH